MAAAGCGGGAGDGASPEAYVRARCTTLLAWKAAVQHAGKKIQGERPRTLAQGRQNYVRFVSELLAATRRAATAMRAAGVPGVSNGPQIEHALVAVFDDAAGVLQQARGRARMIPINGTRAYTKAVGALTASIRTTMTKMGSVSPGDSSQLQAAAATSPACKPLIS
jgi:hypothetical protein